MVIEREGSRQGNFMRPATPEEINRYQNGVGLSARRPDNPGDLLFDIFRQRGYPLEFTPTDSLTAEMSVQGEAFDVFCYNPDFRANFKLEESIIQQMHTFRFLALVTQGEQADLELVEQIVAGNFTEVQGKFPAAEQIGLSPEEMKQCLATAYRTREAYLAAAPDYQRRFVIEVHNPLMAAIERQMPPHARQDMPEDMQQSPAQIDELTQWVKEQYAEELETVRRKRQNLGVDPLPPERVREIVTALVDRTEAFIAGRAPQNPV